MFYEMDGSFHRDAIGSQAGRMEHPCGSGAESLMSSAKREGRPWDGCTLSVLGQQLRADGELAFHLSLHFSICSRNRR